MFFAKIASMVVAFFATAYIARNLGPNNYGQLSYALSFIALFSFLSTLGVDQIVYRDVMLHPEKKNTYIGSALVIRIIASTVAGILAFGTALLFSTEDVSLFLIGILSLTFVAGSFSLLSTEFQVEAKSKYPSIFSVFVVIVLNLAKIAVIFFNKGVIYLAAVTLLEPILYSCVYLYLRTKLYGHVTNLRFDKQIALKIIKDSYPLIFASAFFMVYARIDQVMIKHMLNAEFVGLYDAAVRMSEISYFIPNIIVVALFPAIVNAKKTSNDLYFTRIKKLLLSLILISTLIAVATTVISKYLTLIIFGAGFLASIPVLQIYVWSNIGTAINVLVQQVLVAENLTKIVSVTIFCGMVVNIVLNIFLIPRLGMQGAALASLIAYMVPFLSLFMFSKTRTLMLAILKH
jgi:O-antigen/teichoic acid export membrane protein